MTGLLIKYGLVALVMVVIGYMLGQAQFELPAVAPSEPKQLDWTLPGAWDTAPASQAAKRLLARFGQPSWSSNQGGDTTGAMATEWHLRGMVHEPPSSLVLIEQGGRVARKKIGDSLPSGEILLQIDNQGILIETLEGQVRLELYQTP